MDHFYHDVEPSVYEEEDARTYSLINSAKCNGIQNKDNYDKVCSEGYGRLHLSSKRKNVAVTDYDTMENSSEHASYSKLHKKNNTPALSEYDTVELCKK